MFKICLKVDTEHASALNSIWAMDVRDHTLCRNLNLPYLDEHPEFDIAPNQ